MELGLILKCLSPIIEVLNPLFRERMLLSRGIKPCLKLLPDLSELWHWRTSLHYGPPSSKPSMLKYFSITILLLLHLFGFCFLLLSSPSDLCLSPLRSSSFSHQGDGARGSLWYKLGQPGPCEAELGCATHSGALSWRFDQSRLGLPLQFQLNISGGYLLICPWKNQEVNTNPIEINERGGLFVPYLIRPLHTSI